MRTEWLSTQKPYCRHEQKRHKVKHAFFVCARDESIIQYLTVLTLYSHSYDETTDEKKKRATKKIARFWCPKFGTPKIKSTERQRRRQPENKKTKSPIEQDVDKRISQFADEKKAFYFAIIVYFDVPKSSELFFALKWQIIKFHYFSHFSWYRNSVDKTFVKSTASIASYAPAFTGSSIAIESSVACSKSATGSIATNQKWTTTATTDVIESDTNFPSTIASQSSEWHSNSFDALSQELLHIKHRSVTSIEKIIFFFILHLK